MALTLPPAALAAWALADGWGEWRLGMALVPFLAWLELFLEFWQGIQFRREGILRVMDYTPWSELTGWTLVAPGTTGIRDKQWKVLFRHRGRAPLQQIVYDPVHLFERRYAIAVPDGRVDEVRRTLTDLLGAESGTPP